MKRALAIGVMVIVGVVACRTAGPARPPDGTSLYLAAGDAGSTARVLAVDRQTGGREVISYEPGDGSVLRSSALMDERVGSAWSPKLRSPIDWTDVMFLFSGHLGMAKDPRFSDNIVYLLLEHPRRRTWPP